MKSAIPPEVATALAHMNTKDIIEAVVEAKTQSKTVYGSYIPRITKQDAIAALSWIIEVAEEGVGINERQDE